MRDETMNEMAGETLSSFLDGELPRPQFELFLKQIDRDPRLRGALTRYAAIGECLRNEPDRLSRGFAARVSLAVAKEAAAAAPHRALLARDRGLRRAGQLAGGLALAATVAAAAILFLQHDSPGPGVPAAQTVADAGSRGTETVVVGNLPGEEGFSYTVPSPVQTSAIVPGARLTDYVFAHSEYSSLLGRRNVLSSVVAEDPTPVGPNEQEAKDGERP